MAKRRDPNQLNLGLRTQIPKFRDGPESLSFARELRMVLCVGKNKFKSARTAHNSAVKLNNNGLLDKLVEAYDCPFCQHWHLMGIPKGEKHD